MMTEANSVDTDTSDSMMFPPNSPKLEKVTRGKSATYSKNLVNLMNDLMMAILKKPDSESHNTNVQGLLKQPKVGLDKE